MKIGLAPQKRIKVPKTTKKIYDKENHLKSQG